jgi:hypothetical protein
MSQLINGPQSQLDNTVRVFDQFYNFQMTVEANRYDIVFSYFLSICNSRDTARNFTTMIFRIASITDEDPLTLLGYMQGKNKIHTTALMTYYLNSLKSKTTLYGINSTPIPNETVQRNIVI